MQSPKKSVVTAFPVIEDAGSRRRRSPGRPRKGRRVWTPKRYSRGKKPWRVIVVEPHGASPAKQRPYYFATEAQAIAFYRQKLLELGGRGILSAALDNYSEHQRRKGNRPSSIKKARERVGRFFRNMLDTDLAELKLAHLQKLYDASAGDGVSNIHRNHSLSETKTFLRWAYREGLVSRSVYERLGDVQPEGTKEAGSKVHLRLDSMRKLLRKAVELYDADRNLRPLAVLLLVRLNARGESDLLQLRIRDVNSEGRAIYFAHAKTKSGEGYRELRCNATRVRLLDAIASRQPQSYLFASNRTGEHFRWRWLNRAVKWLCGEADVDVVNVKQLRASAAEYRALAGDDPIEIAAQKMGHSEAARGAVARKHYVRGDVAANIDAGRVNDAIGVLN